MSQKPLNSFPAGTVVRIADINGGRGARSRMLALGLTPGCPVQILGEGPSGYRVRIRGCDVVLCCGLAGKIMAVENSSDEGPRCCCCPAPRARASSSHSMSSSEPSPVPRLPGSTQMELRRAPDVLADETPR